jgi:hypothetical protein
MDGSAVEVVRPERAVRAPVVGFRIEHEVIDDELAVVVEQVRQRLLAGGSLEHELLRHLLPRQLPPLACELLPQPAELLLLHEQRLASVEPLLG